MASPKAAGKFSGAIPLSNLGGINYGTTYSKYYTIKQEAEVAAKPILAATNCTDAASQLECLRAIPARTLASLPTVARFLVVDGTYLVRDELQLKGATNLSSIALMMGITHDDGAPFIAYPTNTTDVAAYLTQVGLPVAPRDLFPLPDSGNRTLDLFNMSSRIATDGIFRCVDQATAHGGLDTGAFGKVYYYEFDRTYQTGGWPNLDVCLAPKTAERPYGDPRRPYLRCHSGEL
jgi:carboxylesterase type B